jgi:hypothetical protein
MIYVSYNNFKLWGNVGQGIAPKMRGLFGFPVMTEKQVVQEGGEPSCRSARCPRNLSLHFAAVGGKTGKTGKRKALPEMRRQYDESATELAERIC